MDYRTDEAGVDHIGPMSQDFNKVFNLGGDDKAISTVDELGVALAAIQELNRKTEKLIETVKAQQDLLSAVLLDETASSDSRVTLHQNAPNPFSARTEIRMEISDEVREAVFYTYDLQGRQIEQKVVAERGESTFVVEGGTLGAGMYLYTLIADGKPAGVKRMILTK